MQFRDKTAYVWGLRYRWDPSLSMNPVRQFAHFMPPWISPQITSKGNCKEKHDLTTNHRQRLPGWRLFRLGKGTTLDRVQSLYPERNYFLWFLGFASQPSAILWGWEVTVFYNAHHKRMYWKEIRQRRPGDRHDKLGTAGLDRHSNLQQPGQSRKSQSPAQQRWNMKIWDWKFRA